MQIIVPRKEVTITIANPIELNIFIIEFIIVCFYLLHFNGQKDGNCFVIGILDLLLYIIFGALHICRLVLCEFVYG
jgi:hypothetical protein